jgi:hypothetical protein
MNYRENLNPELDQEFTELIKQLRDVLNRLYPPEPTNAQRAGGPTERNLPERGGPTRRFEITEQFKRRNNKSGYVGVDYREEIEKWRARLYLREIMKCGCKIRIKPEVHLGCFGTREEAAKAVDIGLKLLNIHEPSAMSGLPKEVCDRKTEADVRKALINRNLYLKR